MAMSSTPLTTSQIYFVGLDQLKATINTPTVMVMMPAVPRVDTLSPKKMMAITDAMTTLSLSTGATCVTLPYLSAQK